MTAGERLQAFEADMAAGGYHGHPNEALIELLRVIAHALVEGR